MCSRGRPPHPAGYPAAFGWALPVALGVLYGLAPQAASAQVAAGPCSNGAPDSREACSGRRLDYQSRSASPLQTVSLLPPGRLGKPYPPSRILYGGTPGYTIDPESRVPQGLSVTPDGFLQGTPSKSGGNVILLIARDSAQPANVVRGIYVLNVLAPRQTKAAGRHTSPSAKR